MKKLLFLVFALFLLSSVIHGQIQTPSLSPGAKIEQRIGLTDVMLEYSRPSIRGRVIFGGLVPYNDVWRTGANSATKITFSTDVVFGGSDVAKGSYALLSKPGTTDWIFMLYPYGDTDWSTYSKSDVQPITFHGAPQMNGMRVQTLTLGFDNLTNSGADFYVMWDNVYVSVPIKISTDQMVEASINKVMAGPTAGDYYSAANYYLNEGKDLKQALTWINKSIEMGNEKYWVLRAKSLIQAGLGDKAGAIVSAQRSLELATKDENKEYIRLNEASIAEWKKM